MPRRQRFRVRELAHSSSLRVVLALCGWCLAANAAAQPMALRVGVSDRVNGDLVAAISRAREIEERLQNFRSAGIGRRKLRHQELVDAFTADLRQRSDALEIDARTVARYRSASAHYLAFTEQREIEAAFPSATMVNREFALKFSAFLSERRISPNGHSHTAQRKMTSTRLSKMLPERCSLGHPIRSTATCCPQIFGIRFWATVAEPCWELTTFLGNRM